MLGKPSLRWLPDSSWSKTSLTTLNGPLLLVYQLMIILDYFRVDFPAELLVIVYSLMSKSASILLKKGCTKTYCYCIVIVSATAIKVNKETK